MSRYLQLVSAVILISHSLLLCSDLIEKKPYTEWTKAEVGQILNASPWVCLCPAGTRVLQYQVRVGDPDSGFSQITMPLQYRVRLLTARPVREAWLRWLELGDIIESTVSAKRLSVQDSSSEKKAALERYLASHTEDGALTGDDKNIIIGITLRIGSYRSLQWSEEYSASELSNISVSELKSETVLSTNTGKRVQLVEYMPPSQDWYGARYYFPRYLAHGTPLVGTNDRELQFKTRINDRPVKAKFDLKKMLYKGKLES
jgi:hypothetical protein